MHTAIARQCSNIIFRPNCSKKVNRNSTEHQEGTRGIIFIQEDLLQEHEDEDESICEEYEIILNVSNKKKKNKQVIFYTQDIASVFSTPTGYTRIDIRVSG